MRFRSTLEIQDLTWLSAAAISVIEEELRERDHYARLLRDPAARASNLTLISLYDRTPGFEHGQIRIRVTIEGKKRLPAVYLISKPSCLSVSLYTEPIV